MSGESKRLKKSRSSLLNSGNAVIQHLSEKCNFRIFPLYQVLAGSAEAQVIWGGVVKRLLAAYFISNISAKKILKSVHMCQSYSKPKVGRFLDTVHVPKPRTLGDGRAEERVSAISCSRRSSREKKIAKPNDLTYH